MRSVFFAERGGGCTTPPCAGPVPPELVDYFRRELAAAGFNVVEARGYAAPVTRIEVDHVATTRTACTMDGAVYVADNKVEVKRSYALPRDARAAAHGESMAAETKRSVLQACLAAFARSARGSLETAASPRAAASRRD